MPIQSVNPATGALINDYAAHTSEEVRRRIARASAAFSALRETSFAQRATWMRAAAQLLDDDVNQLAKLITQEMGKPVAQSRAEVAKSSRSMRFYADNAERFLGDELLPAPDVVGASQAGTRYDPIGIVLAVMPWNYPIWQVIRFAAPALMAGNVGLLKHASNVPGAALYLDDLFSRAGFPEGSFQALLIGAADVEQVIADPRVRAVTLTGSEPAGRAVGASSGTHIKKVVLELGGSDPFIVMPSADPVAAARVAVRARVANNGQSCIAAKRFIIHEEVYEDFVAEFTRGMASLVVGDPSDDSVDVGPMATSSGRDELAELVSDAVAKGATLLAGGSAPDRDGWYYLPTVLSDLDESMDLVHEEAFGPVATVYRVSDLADALGVANQTRFGLSSAIWTNDADEQEWLIRRLEAGAVFVNGMSVSYPELPFGGVKDSGVGRELAAAGIREFCNLKSFWRAA